MKTAHNTLRAFTKRLRNVLPECVIAVCAFTLALLVASSMSAGAHTDVFVDQRWDSDPTLYRGYLTGVLNTEEARVAMYRADNAWDDVYGSNLDFIDSSYQDTDVKHRTNACATPEGVWYMQRSLPNSTYARAQRCYSGDEIIKASVSFNSNHDWYLGTGTPPSGESDLWGVATHELGHTTGFSKHLTGSDLCPSNSGKHTMCPSWTKSQLPDARTLESHDKHSIAGAY